VWQKTIAKLLVCLLFWQVCLWARPSLLWSSEPEPPLTVTISQSELSRLIEISTRAVSAQRAAQERSGRFAADLEELAGHARKIDHRTGRLEVGIGALAAGLDGAYELADGLDTAAGSADDSQGYSCAIATAP
jgi:hypothetical protein